MTALLLCSTSQVQVLILVVLFVQGGDHGRNGLFDEASLSFRQAPVRTGPDACEWPCDRYRRLVNILQAC